MAPRWHLDHTSTNISVGFRDIETTQLPVCQESYERCWVWGVGLSLLHKIPDTQFASFKIQHWIWKIWETFGSVWRDISHEQLLETSFFSTKCTNAHYGPCWRFCFVPVSDSGHERIPVNGQRQHLTVIVVHETHGTRSTESIESGTTGTTGMIDVSWGSPDCALWQSLQMDVALHVAWCCYNFWKFTKLQKMYVKPFNEHFQLPGINLEVEVACTSKRGASSTCRRFPEKLNKKASVNRPRFDVLFFFHKGHRKKHNMKSYETSIWMMKQSWNTLKHDPRIILRCFHFYASKATPRNPHRSHWNGAISRGIRGVQGVLDGFGSAGLPGKDVLWLLRDFPENS